MHKVHLPIVFLLLTISLQAQVLDQHHWKDRIILLFAESPEQNTLVAQLKVLTKRQDEVTERHLKVYKIFPEVGFRPNGEALKEAEINNLRFDFDAVDVPFLFVLIGKDGTVKLRKGEMVTMDELFKLIDSMPMRRREMKDQNRN